MKRVNFKPKLALALGILFLSLSYLIPVLYSIFGMILGLADQTAKFVNQKYPLSMFMQAVLFIAIFYSIYAIIAFVIFLVKNYLFWIIGLNKSMFASFCFNTASILSMIPVARRLVKTVPLCEYDAILYARFQDWARSSGNEIEGIQILLTKNYSSETNAFFLRLGSFHKMTLVDSLFDRYTHSEIVAIVAHEFGHKHDFINTWATVLVRLFGAILIAGWGIWSIFSSSSTTPIPLTVLLIAIYWFFTMVLNNVVSRYREMFADIYAVLHIPDGTVYKSVIQKLSEENHELLIPPGIIEFVFYSHPSPIRRLANADSLIKAMKKT